MKCQPEYLTSEWLFRRKISAREMVNAPRHTFNLLSDPLQRFSKRRGHSEEVNIYPGVILGRRGQLAPIRLPSFRLYIRQRRPRLRQQRQQ